MRRLLCGLVVIYFMGVSLCDASQKIRWPALQGKGLVVGQVSGLKSLGFLDIKPMPTPAGDILILSLISISVDGVEQKDAHLDSYIVFAKKPGRYTLDSIFQSSFLKGRGANPLALQRTFRVEEGKITNLGLMLFTTDPNDNKKISKFYIDNSSHMREFLANFGWYTVTADQIDGMTLAEGPYLTGAELEALRSSLAAQTAFGGTYLIPADAGTLAWVTASREKTSVRLLPSPTLSNIQSFQWRLSAQNFARDRLVFLTKDNRLYLVQEDRVQELASPVGEDIVEVFWLNNALIAISERDRVSVSDDEGKTWTPFQLTAAYLPPFPPEQLVAVLGKNQDYIYSQKSTFLFSLPHGKKTVRAIPTPRAVSQIESLREMDDEIVLSDLSMSSKRASYYTRPVAGPAPGRPDGWETSMFDPAHNKPANPQEGVPPSRSAVNLDAPATVTPPANEPASPEAGVSPSPPSVTLAVPSGAGGLLREGENLLTSFFVLPEDEWGSFQYKGESGKSYGINWERKEGAFARYYVHGRSKYSVSVNQEKEKSLAGERKTYDNYMKKTCQKYTSTTVSRSPVGPYSSETWIGLCVSDEGLQGVVLKKLIRGKDNFYDIQKTWQSYYENHPVRLDKKELDLWKARLAAVSVCDTRGSHAPCPKIP